MSLFVNNILHCRILFGKQNSDEIFYAYINPKTITKTSYISENSRLLVGDLAITRAIGGLWGNLCYNFSNNIIYKLCYELMNYNMKGEVYNYIAKHHSEEEAKRIWEKLHRFKFIFEEGKYKSQFEGII